MIFKGIKRKTNQIFFKKELRKWKANRVRLEPQKIRKALVFVDKMSGLDDIYYNLLKLLKLKETDVLILTFEGAVWDGNEFVHILSERDFGYYGKLKSERLKIILTNRYDLLINYSKVENLYSNILLLQCETAFRVGFAHLDDRFYDLLIDCEPGNIELFNAELIKYLKILNKIK